jgi:cell filamentation protein
MLDYSYEYDYDDIYCYNNSAVLKNKLNITDRDVFFKAEREITSLRSAQLLVEPIPGTFNEQHFKSVHKFLFDDIYDWAGNYRRVNISKGSNFCQVAFIEQEMGRIFSELKAERALKGVKQIETLAKRLAYYMGELNAVHPFREGNGRTQRLFASMLAQRNGYSLQFDRSDHEQMLNASIESFAGNYVPMEELMLVCLAPTS